MASPRTRIKSVSYAKYGYYFILPFFLVYAVFMFTPLIRTFILSTYGNGTPQATATLGEKYDPKKTRTVTPTRQNYLNRTKISEVASVKGSSTTFPLYQFKFDKDQKEVIYTGHFGASDGATVYDFVGAKNFASIFAKGNEQHDEFLTSLKNTFLIWGGNFLPQLILSLALAVWFTDARLKIPGKGFFKVIMYMPNILTAASVAVLFLGILSKMGPINALIHPPTVGADGVIQENLNFTDFVGSPNHPWSGRIVIMFIQTWMWFGNTMIMLMSGIMGINPSLFEASEIDGANSTQTFWNITVPILSPILVYTVITSMIGGLQMFDIPALYTQSSEGKPEAHLKTVAVYIFRQYADNGTTGRSSGYAATASVILFVITVALGVFIFRMNRDHDEVEKRKARKKMIKQEKAKAKQFGGLSI